MIGITSEMDYFNQNYENQKQISGLLVAENEQDLFILTEYRVVENVQRIQVTFYDGSVVDAIYQRHDANTGLTVLRVSLADLDESTRRAWSWPCWEAPTEYPRESWCWRWEAPSATAARFPAE